MSKSEFGSLILSHQSFLQQLAMKLTKSFEDSNDLMQETYFKALKNKDKFQEGTNIKGWLYTIMKNTFINAYRKKKNQNTFVDETDNKYFINMGETEKSVQTDAVVDREYMMKQINSVEKTYVETFMMYYNGYKYEEIAEILEIPLGTVKSRIFLARRKMMDKLKDYR
ncbi:MAG TPA: RNA polymerase subunit sigma [Cryomorphaceae bacterium]|nr:RNA polymerase subunit sigma [Owenweeksia sp.]MBF97910.1 RNA polymerase subunit sigma [Owenweeksia sp.]HAD97233.1 RNA polymerase subunit sigma [Cryomorphaceae bacterium]HBF20054.1 RNA polymerase subunit sigma [Cryomorphaceae bacterium]HCQ14734.1 RNA polymerase subunit sigma [Cryomorphaceae bacterium]|tara:strand:- start:333 stop:836 length:504 start_codon:yes stop_codon:yes gene_type:complete